jgi:tetratricopeptide (TPR) repeat protein
VIRTCAAAGILASSIVTAGAQLAAAQVAVPTAPRVLVMPFENIKRDSRIVWLGEASAVLLADNLNALGTSAITRAERREAFERLQVPQAATLSDATTIRIAQIVGAAKLVVGTVEVQDETLVVHARAITLDAGRIQVDSTETGPLSELFAIFERLARRVALQPGTTQGDAPHPSIAAFEDYIKGLLAEAPATGIKFLTSALTQQPSFDEARLAMWDIYTNQGDFARALQAVQGVPSTSPSSSRARFLAALSMLELKKYDEAFTTFSALADSQPTAAVLNDLGVVQLRRGGIGKPETAAAYFTKASAADPADPDYFFNLGYTHWLGHEADEATRWLLEAVRRDPADGDAHFVLAAALSSLGRTAEASRERELARRLSSTYEQLEKRPAGGDIVPRGMERVKRDVELPHARTIASTLATNELQSQQELAQFYLERGRRLYQHEDDRQAIEELNRALYLSPYEPEAHLLLGRIYLRNGRAREAIDDLKICVWSRETAEAHVVLGEAYLEIKDVDAAVAEAERALTLQPKSTDAQQLLQKAGARTGPQLPRTK